MDINKLCNNCFFQKGDAEICPNCGYQQGAPAESPLQLSPGSLLADNYIIGKALGQGGFGITYLAWDINLNIKLAIKEYFPQQYATRTGGHSQVSAFAGSLGTFYEFGLEKFLQEARTLAKFEGHPNIVSVRNYFEANGTAYLIMRYVEGITLKEYLNNQGGTIPFEQAKALMMPVFDALKEVHAAGILHRDISPDNIFINEKGQVVLLDFGAARQAISEKGKTLSVILKPGYAPEEQYRSKGVQGTWTDVYSLAATFYRLITGWQPPEALERLVEDPIVSPSHMGVDIDDWDERVLLKGLAVRAENRYQTVESFQSAILGQEEPEEVVEPPNVTTYTAPLPQEESDVEVTYAAPAAAKPPDLPGPYQQESTPKAPIPTAGKADTKETFSFKKNHLIAIGTVVAVLLLTFVAYNFFFGAIDEIILEETSLTLEAGGEEFQLKVSVKPIFASKNNLIWSIDSTEEGIASIDQDGVVRPLKVGAATITVATADYEHRAECLLEITASAISWEGGSYSGEQLDGIPHGEGSWSHPDGTEYKGQWENGLFHGSGSWTGADGRKYEGDFMEGLFDGEGILITAGGDRYVGQFSEGLYHGQGKFTGADGTIYEGTFIEGKRHGEGKLTLADGTVETGIWEDGMKVDIEEVAEEEKETEVSTAEESPTPPPSTEAKNSIPSIGATVVSFKFYETGSPTARGGQRSYNTRFEFNSSRYICWQLYLTHPASESIKSFNLSVTRTFGGSSQVVENRQYHIPAGATSTDLIGVCIGTPGAGNIPPGRYQISIQTSSDGTVATGSFEVF